MKENRESFFARINRVFAPSQGWRIWTAYTIAKGVHRGQFRKETDEEGNLIRYFEHLRRVALIVIDEFRLRDPDAVIAGLLHDCVEDCGVDPAMIEHNFGRRPTEIVLCVTHRPDETDAQYADRMLGFGDWVDLVDKLADRLDNMRSIGSMPPEKRVGKARETLDLFAPILRNRLQEIAPAWIVPRLKAAWDEIETICRAIVEGWTLPTAPETPPE